MTQSAWSSDLLGRKSDALFLIDFLVRKTGERGQRGSTRSFVLNIDAGWGQGKSYFLENLRLTLEEQQYVVAYVNAWNDDHADDPLIAVMSAIEAAVTKRSAVKTKQPLSKLTQIGGQAAAAAAAAKGVIKQAVNRYIGEDAWKEMSNVVGGAVTDASKSAGEEAAKKIAELYDSEGKALLEKFHVGQRTISEFKKQLSKVVGSFKDGIKRPLFILIDELDRCRPLYAVALLERVKHLFDVDDVVFVMATDTDQLRHSIAALYGINFAAGRYLLRFFDQTYRFGETKVDDFVRQQFSDIDCEKLFGSPAMSPEKFAASAFKAFRLSLRDIEQCTDIIRNCVTVWDSPAQIVLLALLPLVILQQQRMPVGYSEIKGELGRFEPGRWKLDFNIYENTQKKVFEGIQLFHYIVERAAQHSLPRIFDDGEKSSEARVCRDIFASEMQARFPNGYMSNNPPVSLIRQYPDLVRSVGRLSPA